MTLLRSDLQLSAPDDVYEAIISLGNGFDERTAHTALAAFALLIANQIGDGKIIYEAIAAVRQALKEYPEASKLGVHDPDRKQFQVGGALASLRKIIEVKPAPSIPGALTS
jgi:Protein of unknown function (DUF2783)